MTKTTTDSFFILSSNCIVSEGFSKSIIIDFKRVEIYDLPKSFGKLLRNMDRNNIAEVRNAIDAASLQDFDDFLKFLIEEEIGFLTNHPQQFPKISEHYSTNSGVIQNAILDFGGQIYNYEKAFEELSALGCEEIQLRFYKNPTKEDLKNILKHLNTTEILFAEILLNDASDFPISYLQELMREITILSRIYLFDAENNDIEAVKYNPEGYYPVNFGYIYFIKQPMTDASSCGHITMKNLLNDLHLKNYLELKEHNGCLNRKISIDTKGNIKNCPSFTNNFGNIDQHQLAGVLEQNEFKKYWKINKNEIKICQDCEYRPICTDCRVFIEDTEDIYSKPSKCGYDPYTGEWNSKSKNPLKEKVS